MSFIFASQQTNYRHLYYIQTKLGETQRETYDQCLAIPLTSGTLEVLGKRIWVDEDSRLVYFLGLRESELEVHLYVCCYRHPRVGLFRITQLAFYHSGFLNKSCTVFVDSYSSLNIPPALTLYRMNPDLLNKEADHADWFQEPCDRFKSATKASELFAFK